MIGRVTYFIREALRGFYQAKLMTSVSILAVTVSLFSLGVIAVAGYNLHALFKQVFQQADMIIYLDKAIEADTGAISNLMLRVGEFPQIAGFTLVDKQEAWRRFEAAYGAEMLDAVDENPLPVSLEITIKPHYRSPGEIERLARELKPFAGIESVDYSPQWLATLQRIKHYLAATFVFLAILCVLILYFVVSNMVKLTIYARKELVINMRFVGATDRYIAVPFIIEGIFQGLAGAFLAAAGILLVQAFAGEHLIVWGPPRLGLSIICIGVVFGWLGSRSAVRKFLV